MSYLDELLGQGEAILFTSRRHWFILAARILAEIILLGLLLAAAAFARYADLADQGDLIALIALAVGLFVMLSALGDYLRWRNEQYVVTDRRVLQLKGVINKRVLDSSLEKINDVELQQSLFGRMFGYGTIEILTASEEAINRMEAIAQPLEFKRAMQDARARYDGYLGRGASMPDVADRSDVQITLEQLASLRDRGILSQAEFEAKKRDVLSRI
ncbi:MAG TPA: PH domain-containing protein [Herpetosiphonaceae bacterium]|nr:PH domain-containing protein [Herpetosiphonaceae bacterium]